MSFIDWAMEHQRAWRKDYLTDTAQVQHKGGTLSVPATKIDPRQAVDGQQLRFKTNSFIFQFDAADVSSVHWQSGIRITWDSNTYEVIIDRNNEVTYDDPTEKTLNVPAKKVS